MKTFDFRDVAFNKIKEIFKNNNKTILLTNDMGATGLTKLKKKYPSRVVNCGICEQHIMSMAGGLASEGYHVFIYGIISHLIFRGLEQLKIDICVDNYHVTIIGIGAGLSYGNDGPTHHAIEDIGVLKSIPNIKIFNPTDLFSIKNSFEISTKQKSPSLIRLDKENLQEQNIGVKRISKNINYYNKSNSKCLIISTGITLKITLDIQKSKKNVDLADIVCLKPFPYKDLKKIILQKKYKKIITIDENLEQSSLIDNVNKLLQTINKRIISTSINLGNNYILGSAKREWVWKKFNFDSEKIIKKHLKNI